MGDSSNVSDKEISTDLRVSLINSNAAGSYALNGKIMLCTVTILFFSVFLILGLHTYARWYIHSRRRQRRRTRLLNSAAGAAVCSDGLDVSTLKSLPTFTYAAADQDPTIADDCAVCLSDFEKGESGRVLPGCGHVFHVVCIDMWFWAHSSCPLCRAAVKPVPHEPPGGRDAVVVLEEVTVEPPPLMEERYVAAIVAEAGSGSGEPGPDTTNKNLQHINCSLVYGSCGEVA